MYMINNIWIKSILDNQKSKNMKKNRSGRQKN